MRSVNTWTKTWKVTTPNYSHAQCGVFEEQLARSGRSSCTPSALTQLVTKHVVAVVNRTTLTDTTAFNAEEAARRCAPDRANNSSDNTIVTAC